MKKIAIIYDFFSEHRGIVLIKDLPGISTMEIIHKIKNLSE